MQERYSRFAHNTNSPRNNTRAAQLVAILMRLGVAICSYLLLLLSCTAAFSSVRFVHHTQTSLAVDGLPSARAAPSSMALQVVDLFPDPVDLSIGGKSFVAPSSSFPAALTAPSTSKAATVTPFPEVGSILFATLELNDAIAAVFVGFALLLGPDFILAPAGIVSNDGIRPGYTLESVLGGLLTPDAQWLKDRRERLKADAPLIVQAPTVTLFLAVGVLVERLLLVAFEDPGFVISLGVCSCIGGSLLEVIREPLPTREERDRSAKLSDEFLIFAADRLTRGGRCHERDIVKDFRLYYPRYRYADMRRTSDGQSLQDDEIADLVRSWNGSMGRPGERTSSGFWKGISLVVKEEVPK